MKKLFPHIVAVLFAVFIVGVIAAMMLYSWQGLGKVFPNDLLGQGFGMLLFDLAALIWFGVLIYRCFSTGQYVISFLGFLVGLLGSLGLIGIEIGLSSGLFEVGSMQEPLTYIFIGVLAGHVVLVYAHHASAPEVSADISLGIEKAKITDKAQAAVEQKINERIDELASPIADALMRGVLQDLKISAHFKDVMTLPALPVEDETPKQEAAAQASFLSWLPASWVNAAQNWKKNAASVEASFPVVTPKQSPAPQNAGSGAAADLSGKQQINCLNCDQLMGVEIGAICPGCGWKSPGIEPAIENELHRHADHVSQASPVAVELEKLTYHPQGFSVVSDEARGVKKKK